MSVLALAACSTTHDRGDMADAHDAGSDSNVFADIAMHVRAVTYDDIDSAADPRLPVAASRPSPVGAGVYVTINGGLLEGRVPELEVWVDGVEFAEVGNAGYPPRFAYGGDLSEPEHGDIVDLELRYQGARHVLPIELLAMELTEPAEGATLADGEPLRVSWIPAGTPPKVGLISSGGFACGVESAVVEMGDVQTTFTLVRRPIDPSARCEMRVSAARSERLSIAPAPLRAVTLDLEVRRQRRFYVD